MAERDLIPVPQKAGTITRRDDFTGQELQQSPETQMAAVAARERALVEAQFLMSERHPRNWDNVRFAMMKHCQRTRFAEIARYSRPVGRELVNGEWVEKRAEGFTTRFTEMLAQEMGNVRLSAVATYEDDLVRIMRFAVLDLEKNVVKEREVAIAKAVERRGIRNKKGEWEPPKGRDVISQRITTQGEPTYLVRATAEELRAKTNAEESRSQRDFITRLCPRDILEDCEDQIRATLDAEVAKDPEAYRKKILDRFAELNIRPSDLDAYMSRPARLWNAKDIEELRGLYAAIRDGQTSFDEAMRTKFSHAEGEETREEHDARLQRQMRAQERPMPEEIAEQRIASLSQQSQTPEWRTRLERDLNKISAQMTTERLRPILMRGLGSLGYESVDQLPDEATAGELMAFVQEHAQSTEDDQLFNQLPDMGGPSADEEQHSKKGFGRRRS